MRTIYKYLVPIVDYFDLDMPEDAHILDFQVQNGHACLWALIWTQRAPERRYFRIIGTGHRVPDEGSPKYVGTIQTDNGRLVWHLFEVTK